MTPEELMEKGKLLLKSKSEDYTTKSRYENFDRQAEIISWFKKPIDQAFAGLIAVKLARLASLLSKDSNPNHESIEDTFIDLINYSALWAGNRSNSNQAEQQRRLVQQNRDMSNISSTIPLGILNANQISIK